jgi:large conductance mechanosensitive channel
MSFIKEFKEFIAKGDAFDLAVGVIVGGAFGPVVNSMVNDVLMPVVSLAVGRVDFGNLYLPLSKAGIEALAAGQPMSLVDAKKLGSVLSYGNLITALVNFGFLMFAVFVLIKVVNTLRRKATEPTPAPTPVAPPEPSDEVKLLSEIRDLLKK